MKLLRPFFKLSILLTGLMVFIASSANATTYYSWGNADPGVLANWWTVNNGTGSHPASFATALDVFTIQNANTYTTTGTWTIAGTVSVSSGGSLVITAANSVTIPTLTVTGSVTNNGTLTIATNLSGLGSFTNTGTGTLNYGSATTISVTTFTITAAGNTVNYNAAGIQTVKTGTYSNLTVSGSGAKTTTSVTVNGIMTMGGTATVSVVPTYGGASTLYYNGTTAQTTGTEFPASFTGSGGVVSNNALGVTINAIKSVSKLTVNAGASFSTGATNTWTLTVTGITTVSGTLTLSNNATKTFTGDVTVNSGGILNIPSTAKTVNMGNNLIVASGGTLNHNNSYDNATIYLQVNGDLNINGTYSYTGFLPAIWMNGAAGTHHVNTGTTSLCKLLLRTGDYYANGTVTIDQDFYAMWNQAGGSFHTNGQTVNAAWGLVDNGGTVYVDGGSLTIGGGGAPGLLVGRTLTQNGDVQVSLGTLTSTNIHLGNPGTSTPIGTVTQSGGTINTGTLDIGGNCVFTHSGGINNINGPLTLENATSSYNQTTGTPTLNIAGTLTNNGVLSTGTGTDLINIQGNWVNNLTFTTSSTNTVTFNGAGGQDIGGTVSSIFNNLTINDAAGVTISKDQTVNNTLTLTSGKFNIGANNLILASTALAVAGTFSATNMIVANSSGEVRKKFLATGSYLFPIGDNTGTAEYSPVTLNFTGGTFAAGAYAGVNVTNAKHPNNASTTDYLNRYWSLSNSGITGSPSFTATATYVAADVAGTESNIAGAKYTGSLPWIKYGVISSNTLTSTAITNTGSGIIITGISNLPPTVSISGGDVTICSGSTTASLSSTVVNATGSISYAWTPATGLSSTTISNPVANPPSTTTYTLTVTDGNGFTGTAMTTITVASVPATPTISAGGPLTFCAGGSVTLTSSAGTTYLWSTGATTASISPTTSGSYTVQVTNAAGCQSASSAASVVTVNALPATPTISAGGPLTFCAGGSVTLTSSAGTTYLWSTGATTASISPTTSGSYTVQITNAAGCQSAASAASVVTVNALPATPTISAGGPLTFCAGGSVTLTSSAGTTYLWSTGATTASISPTTSGSYTVQVTNAAGCQSASSAATVVTVNALPATPTISAGGPLTFCAGGSVTLTSSAGTTYLWSTGATTASISPTTSGSYTVQVTNAAGCQSASSAASVVTVNALPATPTISAGGPLTFCAGGSVTLTSSAGTTYLWSTGATTASISPTTSGSYTVQVTNAAGCQSASSAATVVTENARPTGSLSGTTTICNGSSTNLTLTVTGAGTISGILSDGTPFSGTAPTITVSVSPSSTRTYTISTLTDGSCGAIASGKTGSATVTVTTQPSATISYPGSPFCSNIGTASVTFSGTSGGTYSISAGGSINSATGTINLVTSAPGIYTVTYTVTASGGCSVYTTTASIIINPNTWTGGISIDWNTPGNWAANAVPTLSCPDVTILSGVPYQPTLGSGTFAIQNLYINSGAYLTISNATLQISGTINNSGTFDVSNGGIELNGGSAQTIPAGAFLNNNLKDLIISNTSASGVSLGGALDIYNSLTYSDVGMKLTTNDYLTFKSTATNTAWLGDMTGNTITGKATVERYIPGIKKGWRFLSIPTNTTQTIQQTWQEGATTSGSNPVPGFGIQLSGAGGTAAGFDVYSAQPSMKTYNSSTGAWVGVPNTNTAGIKATDGYMVFVRGDRTITSPFVPAVPTVLRTKGTLYTGNQTPIAVAAGKFVAIGNPYPAEIDMRNITKPGTKDFFYVWDAALAGSNGYGAYQTFSNNGSGNYVITPGGGSYGTSGSISNYIQSGQAFFVQGDVGGGSLTFKEAAKTTGSGVLSIAPLMPAPQLRVNLFGVNADNSTYITDGLLINYDDNYSNTVDDMDAIKSSNGSENLSVKTAGKLLVVERRHTITGKDTIFLNLTGVSARKYRFEFMADQLYRQGLSAFLEDNYLHTSTPLYIDGTTDVNFTVTSAAASYAANRFMIVFSQLGTLPVTFTSVKAYRQDKNINVEWKVDNELNMKEYETQKSVDGNLFTTLSVTAATANGGHSASYLVADTHPVEGYNYYRIKSVDLNGKTATTSVVKVLMGTTTPAISVYPNPVSNGIIHLQLDNQPVGKYGIRLLNKSGQVMMQRQLEHADGSSTETISLDKYAPRGIYQLEVTKPDGTKSNINVVY